MYSVMVLAPLLISGHLGLAANIAIKITNLKSVKGQICYTLVNENSREFFPYDGATEDGSRNGCVTIDKIEGFDIMLRNLPPGEFAIALFHDEDMDMKLRTFSLLIFKVPAEPFGFSNLTSLPFGLPSFDDCSFKVAEIVDGSSFYQPVPITLLEFL